MDTCDFEAEVALMDNITNFIHDLNLKGYYIFSIEYIKTVPMDLLYFLTFISLTILILLCIIIIKTQYEIIIDEKKYLDNFKYLLEKNNINIKQLADEVKKNNLKTNYDNIKNKKTELTNDEIVIKYNLSN